jgi:TonB-linked SusC/RagA family outer membrane protein
MIRLNRRLWTLTLAMTAASFGGQAQAQGTGLATITGRVTDAQSGQPVVGAQVRVVNSNLGAIAGDDGRYVIRAVSPGSVDVRATRIGFAEQKRTLNVAAGATETADFALARVAVQLSEVVTTATGEQRRVEIANAVTTIDAVKAVEGGNITSVGDLLATRSPSVNVLQSGMVGAGTRVRIRGTSSLSLSNEPIYIVDGIRIESGAQSLSSNIGVGGTVPSRTNDLNPDEIETIDVVRGPSAATLYGTDAANGVIVITTKRGRVGAPRWLVYTEQGVIKDQNSYPTNYTPFGHRGLTATQTCYLREVAVSGCLIDSLRSFNVLENKTTTPFTNGSRQEYGAQVSGGNAGVRYFISGEYEGQDGVYRIPGFDKQRLLAAGIKIRPEWSTPNMATRGSARVNLDVALSEKADVAVKAGFTQNLIRLPENDNNVTGLFGNTLLAGGRTDLVDAAGNQLYGYNRFLPGDIYQETVEQDINRFIGSVNPQYRPFTWLTVVGDAGLDYTGRTDSDICRFAECTNFGTNRLGRKENDRSTILQYTTNLRSTATTKILSMVDSRLSLGVQYTGSNFNRNGSGSSNLPVSASTTTAGSVPFADEATTLSRTIGAYLEEQISLADRLFVTVGARADRSSAFGVDFGNVVYPKASLSYVISDEPFFPKPLWLNQLRLRTALGASGVRPGSNDALQYFATNAVAVRNSVGTVSDYPGVVVSTLGNRDLKPEKSTELEAGIDGTFLDSRFNVEVTYYDKNSVDALVNQIIAPSLGTLATGRFANLGKINNHGFEYVLSGRPIDLPVVAWDFALNGSYNTNKIVSLGVDAAGKPIPPIIGTTIAQVKGQPLNSYYDYNYYYSDANGDGLIAPSEVTISTTKTFQGYSLPRREMSFTTGLEFLDKVFRLQAVLDYKGGNKLYNNTERIRCQSFNNCNGLVNATASLADQARVIALRFKSPQTTQAGWYEKADFTRLREVSLTWSAPERWATTLHGRSLSATLAGRNLALWSKYSGMDPEASYGQADTPAEFLTQPPLSFYTLRVNVGL